MPVAYLAWLLGPAAAPAAAHADLDGTTPRDGSTLDRAPSEIELRFDEPVQSTSTQVVVTAPDDSTVPVGEVDVLDSTATARIGTLPVAGEYTVGWRVVSADGHPIDGVLTFTVTDAVATQTSDPTVDDATASASTSAEQGSWLAAFVWYVGGGAAAVGLGLLLWWRERRAGG